VTSRNLRRSVFPGRKGKRRKTELAPVEKAAGPLFGGGGKGAYGGSKRRGERPPHFQLLRRVGMAGEKMVAASFERDSGIGNPPVLISRKREGGPWGKGVHSFFKGILKGRFD